MPVLINQLEKVQGTLVSEPLHLKDYSTIKFKRLLGEEVEEDKFLIQP